jgi:hypothetical protein
MVPVKEAETKRDNAKRKDKKKIEKKRSKTKKKNAPPTLPRQSQQALARPQMNSAPSRTSSPRCRPCSCRRCCGAPPFFCWRSRVLRQKKGGGSNERGGKWRMGGMCTANRIVTSSGRAGREFGGSRTPKSSRWAIWASLWTSGRRAQAAGRSCASLSSPLSRWGVTISRQGTRGAVALGHAQLAGTAGGRRRARCTGNPNLPASWFQANQQCHTTSKTLQRSVKIEEKSRGKD